VIEWRDEGLVLAARAHGENAVILEMLTRDHGRHLGVVHGGRSRRKAPMLQPGNQLDVTWKARLDSHLGSFAAELRTSRAARILADPLRLAGLTSTTALAAFVLPEREAMPEFAARTEALCDRIASGEGWLTAYLDWEMALLDVAGIGLDLTACAGGGGANDLAYVSPRTGRAVSREAAGEYAARLLPLPDVMLGGPADVAGILAGLEVTGHFLRAHLAPSLGDRPIPPARGRLTDGLRREA
jgi:DNA repair protein RecO (recombination protein O)